MYKTDFYTPKRQSKTGIILIFSATVYKSIKTFWVAGAYILIAKANSKTLLYAGAAFCILAVIALIYSIFYYLKFTFFIDEKNKAFVLNKGVFSSDVINIPFNKIQQVNFKRNILQRVIGVYSVLIDTAGSSDKEVEIKALSKEDADLLADLLMEFSAKEKGVEALENEGEEIAAEAKEVSKQWDYKLKFSRLLLLGFTSNYFRGFSLIMAFYFTVRGQFGYDEESPIDIPYPQLTEIATTFVLIVALIFIAMMATVIEVFIKYFGLHVIKTSNGLQVEMGLRNNTKVSLKDNRVQLVQTATNPLQRKFDLHKVQISLASSQDDLSKQRIVIPALPLQIVEKVKTYFYGVEIEPNYYLLPNKILLLRKFMGSLVPLIIGLGLHEWSPLDLSIFWQAVISSIYIVLVFTYQYFSFLKIKLAVSNDFVVKQYGLWNRRKDYIEMYKLQSVSISQPVWYKKRNLVNLVFHSAGGDIHFSLVEKAEVETLMNYLLYKIESTEKPWM